MRTNPEQIQITISGDAQGKSTLAHKLAAILPTYALIYLVEDSIIDWTPKARQADYLIQTTNEHTEVRIERRAEEKAAKYREERDLARSEVDRLRRKLDEAQNPCLSFGPPTAPLEIPQEGDVVITPAGRVGKLVEKRRDGIGMVRFTETVKYEVPLAFLRRHEEGRP